MSTIAMSREMGSHGKSVAEAVAEKLNATLIHYELIDHLADRERIRKSHVVRLLEAHDEPGKPMSVEDTMPAIMSATEIIDLAMIPESVILRGWGGVPLLKEVPHVVRVRVTAPPEARLANLRARFPSTAEDVLRQEITDFDEAHNAIMQRHFNTNFDDASLYDLVLDTSVDSPETCASKVLAFTQDKRFIETRTSRLKLVSLSRATHIKALLRLHPPTRHVEISVSAREDEITLSGTVESEELRERCEKVAYRAPGVTKVHNQLTVVAA
jgi:cytidylate kinase